MPGEHPAALQAVAPRQQAHQPPQRGGAARQTRLAELLAALSLVTDLARGHPAEEAMRACLLATALARRGGLPEADVATVYYTTLLRSLGCTASSHDYAAGFGDDVIFRQRGDMIDAQSAEGIALLWAMTRGAGLARPFALAGMVRRAGQIQAAVGADCEVAARTAQRFGLGAAVQAALGHVFERWDGHGAPHGRAGEAIALPARIASIAYTAVMFEGTGGQEAAVAAVRRWRGRLLDPHLADTFLDDAADLLAIATPDDVWEAVVAAEPEPQHVLSAGGLDAVAEGFADLADLKSTSFHGHSGGVARLAEGASRLAGLDDSATSALRRAALLHDVGRVGVPTTVWDKAGPLTRADWEQVRLHPYHTERILSRAPALAAIARLAGTHHERMDGAGYYRGLPAPSLDTAVRLLAAADAYHALTEARPHRAALDRASAARTLEGLAAQGQLDPSACRAVIAAAGEQPRLRASYPAGLSEREVEVLRLIATGVSERQVATRLILSPATVHTHVTHIYGKTGVSTRAALALFAMEHHLLGTHPAAEREAAEII